MHLKSSPMVTTLVDLEVISPKALLSIIQISKGLKFFDVKNMPLITNGGYGCYNHERCDQCAPSSLVSKRSMSVSVRIQTICNLTTTVVAVSNKESWCRQTHPTNPEHVVANSNSIYRPMHTSRACQQGTQHSNVQLQCRQWSCWLS